MVSSTNSSINPVNPFIRDIQRSDTEIDESISAAVWGNKDILPNIFNFLSGADIDRNKSVCGNWCDVIRANEDLSQKIKNAKCRSLFRKVYRMTESIKDAVQRDQVLRDVVKEQAKVDPEAAAALARSIGDVSERDQALWGVVKEQAKVDPEAAVALARSIQFAWEREGALSDVAVEQAKVDPEAAVALARSIENAERRDQALRGIAVELAKVDPEAAAALARSIEDAREREGALSDVAKEQAKVLVKLFG